MASHPTSASSSDVDFDQKPDKIIANSTWEALIAEMEESWTPHWKEITERIAPRRGRWRGQLPNRGDKMNGSIKDSTAAVALRVMSAGMHSGITSPNWPWFKLGTLNDPGLARFGPVRQWIDTVELEMFKMVSRSNSYQTFPSIYQEMGAVATSAMHVDQAPEIPGIHCTQYTIGSYALGSNERNKIDTIARRAWLTVGQLVKRFGHDALSQGSQSNYRSNNLNKWVEVRHLIEPNDHRISDSLGPSGMPWRSLWWEKDSDEETWLRRSGYPEFPVMCPRWEVKAESVYGTDCPGMMVLPDVKQLNHTVSRKSEALEKLVRPPLAVPSAMAGRTVSLAPAAITYVDGTQVDRAITPILTTNPNLADIRVDIGELQNSIQRGFFADLFITLLQSRNQPPQRTATEIASIESEKLLMLGPVLERIFDDLLRPYVERLFGIGLALGMFPDAPQDLEGQELDVEFTSALAQAQKAVRTVTLERGVGFVGNLAGVQPDVLDVIDFDGVVEDYWDDLGAPSKLIVAKEIRAQQREARAQQAQMAAGVEAAGGAAQGAQAAKLLSETEVGSESALDRLLTGAAAQGLPPVA